MPIHRAASGVPFSWCTTGKLWAWNGAHLLTSVEATTRHYLPYWSSNEFECGRSNNGCCTQTNLPNSISCVTSSQLGQWQRSHTLISRSTVKWWKHGCAQLLSMYIIIIVGINECGPPCVRCEHGIGPKFPDPYPELKSSYNFAWLWFIYLRGERKHFLCKVPCTYLVPSWLEVEILLWLTAAPVVAPYQYSPCLWFSLNYPSPPPPTTLHSSKNWKYKLRDHFKCSSLRDNHYC
jgi:hypothetical protein